MNGAQIIVEFFRREGISLVFSYPGATSMPLSLALLDSGIRVVQPRHEQGAAFAAEGYARATGKAGVCIATSGPGATNLVTGIADAYMDSIPLVAITAQVHNRFIGKNAFQETDIIGLTRPVVKHSFLVLNIEELPEILKDAFTLAETGRPGPVLIDVPCNFLHEEQRDPLFPEQANLRALPDLPDLDAGLLKRIRKLLRESRRPCIYAGGGIISAGAERELLRFAETNALPVTTSLMGIGAFPESNPLSLRWLGMHGMPAANRAVAECDLLLTLGARFSDRVTGRPENFAPHATVIHVDADASELNKNKQVDIPVLADVRHFLSALNRRRVTSAEEHAEWLAQLAKWKRTLQKPAPKKGGLHGARVMELLHRYLGKDTTLVTGVGQHQMWAAQYCTFDESRRFLTSGGLGAMGFGLPAAIGAQLARPEETVVLVDGDGSFQMNIQELATVFAEHLPLKMILMNNQRLGMVAQWEEKFYGKRAKDTDLSLPGIGAYPDFCAIAKGYGIPALEIREESQFLSALRKTLADRKPCLLNLFIEPDDEVM